MTPEQRERIVSKVTKSFMFNTLNKSDLKTVILEFVEKSFEDGEAVITQGEQVISISHRKR
jgi:hypothetical protein